MFNRDDKIKELTNRLNHRSLQRRELARKEQGVYHQLRIVVFGPAPPRNTAAVTQEPLPDEVRSGDSEGQTADFRVISKIKMIDKIIMP